MPKRMDWTVRDLAVLREHYPLGGPRAVWERLPVDRKRSFDSIHCYAKLQGIKSQPGRAYERNRSSTPEIDKALRTMTRSEVSARFGVSREWILARAKKLDIRYDVRAPRRWTPEEDAVLARSEGKGNGQVRHALSRAGFNRGIKAIIQRRHRLKISGRREFEGYFTLHELAGLLGRHVDTVARFSNRRKDPLPVRREGQMYLYKERDLRDWIARNPEWMDFTKLPRANYPWFIELLTGIAPESRRGAD